MSDLRLQLAAAKAQVTAIEREIAAEERRKLEAEHQALRMECRAAQAEVDRLREEANQRRDAFIRLRGEADNISRHVADWRISKPAPSSYPTEQELLAWRTELQARQAAAAEAERACAEACKAYQMARTEWMRAREALEKLAERESLLRGQLEPQRSPIEITVHDGAAEGVRLIRV